MTSSSASTKRKVHLSAFIIRLWSSTVRLSLQIEPLPISAKESPGDFDAIFLYDDHVQKIISEDKEAMNFLDYTRCKQVGFDLLAFSAEAARKYPEWVHTDAFDKCKHTGVLKGVLEVAIWFKIPPNWMLRLNNWKNFNKCKKQWGWIFLKQIQNFFQLCLNLILREYNLFSIK